MSAGNGHWATMDQGGYKADDQQYYGGAQDTAMSEVPAVGDDMDSDKPKRKTLPWERLGPDGRAIKRKPNPAKKNAVFRKALQPKSSIMCLNELQSGLKYVTEPVAAIGNFCVSVEVNGSTFRGFGTTKDLAKQAAAEAALVSFVKPPPPKPPAGEAPNPEEDTTPWRTLASFAMYKLFSDWRDGRIGMTSATGQHGFVPGMTPPAGMQNMIMQQNLQGSFIAASQQSQAMDTSITKDEPINNVSLHLNRAFNTAIPNPATSTIPMPGADVIKTKPEVKINTENQRTRHPVMILHQLCPLIKYQSSEALDPETHARRFVVNAVLSDQQFTGEGNTIKVAKFNLAKTALKTLYNIDNNFELP